MGLASAAMPDLSSCILMASALRCIGMYVRRPRGLEGNESSRHQVPEAVSGELNLGV